MSNVEINAVTVINKRTATKNQQKYNINTLQYNFQISNHFILNRISFILNLIPFLKTFSCITVLYIRDLGSRSTKFFSYFLLHLMSFLRLHFLRLHNFFKLQVMFSFIQLFPSYLSFYFSLYLPVFVPIYILPAISKNILFLPTPFQYYLFRLFYFVED